MTSGFLYPAFYWEDILLKREKISNRSVGEEVVDLQKLTIKSKYINQMAKKLGFEKKGDFQTDYFDVLVKEYFKGGNGQGAQRSIANDIAGIVHGLSLAWDKADEESQ